MRDVALYLVTLLFLYALVAQDPSGPKCQKVRQDFSDEL